MRQEYPKARVCCSMRGEIYGTRFPQSKQGVRFRFVSTQSHRSRQEFIGRTGRFQLQLCPTAAPLREQQDCSKCPQVPLGIISGHAGESRDTHTKPPSPRNNLDMEDRIFFKNPIKQWGKRCSSPLCKNVELLWRMQAVGEAPGARTLSMLPLENFVMVLH